MGQLFSKSRLSEKESLKDNGFSAKVVLSSGSDIPVNNKGFFLCKTAFPGLKIFVVKLLRTFCGERKGGVDGRLVLMRWFK